MLTQDEAKNTLEGVLQTVRDQFPNATERLKQLADHGATVVMVVEHIFEEAARATKEAELDATDPKWRTKD